MLLLAPALFILCGSKGADGTLFTSASPASNTDLGMHLKRMDE